MDVAEPEAEVEGREAGRDLHVDVQPGRECALAGVRNEVRALIRINGPELQQTERPPLQVACVLDCSFSMGGAPLDFAKRAVLKLVKHLGEQDTLHFITYADTAQVVFRNGDLSPEGKESLRAKILAVRENGRTNLFAGLEQAFSLLGGGIDLLDGGIGFEPPDVEPDSEQAPASDAKIECVKRIFLFSDGIVNVGLTDPAEIQRRIARWAEKGITTSSFGIGQSFDEPLMRGIAQRGKGHYTYLATARDITKLVSKAIHGLLDIYGSQAVLEVRGRSYTTVRCVYGEDDADEDDAATASTSGTLSLGDLHLGSERKVLVELEASPPGDVSEGSVFTSAQWHLSFQRSGSTLQFSGEIMLRATSDRAALGSEATAVTAVHAIQQAAELDGEIAEHLARCDRAKARSDKEKQVALLEKALERCRQEDPESKDSQSLARVLLRAQRVAEQLVRQDMEVVRRQCVQERELNYACSDGGWASACDSDASPPDVANMDDLSDMSPNNSPINSPRSFGSNTPVRSGNTPVQSLLFAPPHNSSNSTQPKTLQGSRRPRRARCRSPPSPHRFASDDSLGSPSAASNIPSDSEDDDSAEEPLPLGARSPPYIQDFDSSNSFNASRSFGAGTSSPESQVQHVHPATPPALRSCLRQSRASQQPGSPSGLLANTSDSTEAESEKRVHTSSRALAALKILSRRLPCSTCLR